MLSWRDHGNRYSVGKEGRIALREAAKSQQSEIAITTIWLITVHTRRVQVSKYDPEGPSTQYFRTLVPKAIKEGFLGPESLNIGYLDPLGDLSTQKHSFDS